MRGELERHSRHLYDIYKIVNLIGITEEMRGLIPKVRKVRSELEICPSAKDNVDVTGILNEIIEKQVYKKDYEEITFGLLFVIEYVIVNRSRPFKKFVFVNRNSAR